MGFIGVLLGLWGFIKGKCEWWEAGLMFGVHLFLMVLSGGLLGLGVYVVSVYLHFGYGEVEGFVYWGFVVPAFLYCVYQFPSKIRWMWKRINLS